MEAVAAAVTVYEVEAALAILFHHLHPTHEPWLHGVIGQLRGEVILSLGNSAAEVAE